MNNPARLILTLLTLCALTTGRAQTPAPKPGYTITLEVSYDETGKPEDAKVVKSDDPTGDHTLEMIAMKMVKQDQQPPKLVDGKPVKFKARRPFNFPVAGDQGEAANANRPVLAAGPKARPAYPENLAAQDVGGGAIMALVIRADGSVQSVSTVQASHPEFAASAEAALRQWNFVSRDTPGTPAESTWHLAVGFSVAGKDVELKWRLAPRPALGSFIVVRPPPAPPAALAAPAAPAPEAPAEKK